MDEELLMFAICTLMGLGCFGAAAGIVVSPETLDMDKIFGLIACSLLGLIFLGISAWMLFNTHLRALWKTEPSATGSKPQETPVKKKEAAS